MTLKEFIKDQNTKETLIEGQLYLRLPLFSYPGWVGIYRENNNFTVSDFSNLLSYRLELIGFVRISDGRSFYRAPAFARTAEAYCFDEELSNVQNCFFRDFEQKLSFYLRDTKPRKSSKISSEATQYFLNNKKPEYVPYYKHYAQAHPKIKDVFSYLTNNYSIEPFMENYLKNYGKEEERIMKNYKTLLYEIDLLASKTDKTTNALKSLLLATQNKKTITLTYQMNEKSWTGKLNTEEFKDIKRFSMGISSWNIQDQLSRINFNDIFNYPILYACGIKELSYRGKTLYTRDDNLFIFCPDSESLSKVIKEEINRPLDNGLIEILKNKYKKEFYYLGYQGVCLLKSEWKENE